MADNSIIDNSALTTQRIINATTGIQTFSSATDSSFSLGPGDTDDYFKLTVSRSSNVILKLNPTGGNANISLLGASGDPNTPIVASMNNSSSLADAIVTDPAVPLQAGQTYYIRVFANNPTTTINYTLSVETVPTTRSDIVWRSQGGLNAVWYMNGTQLDQASLLNPSFVEPGWSMYSFGTFDSSGNPNYLWRQPVDGTNAIWFMDTAGVNLQGAAYLPSFTGGEWYPAGTGDFNNDGNQDILWTTNQDGSANYIWLMDGISFNNAIQIDSLQDPGWRVQAVADLNGDNNSDLWYRNIATGENLIWLMNGAQFQGQIGNLPSLDPNFDVKGVGDFNGDGQKDVVFRNRVTGEIDVWFMNQTSFLSSTIIATVDPSWDISGIISSPQQANLTGNTASTAFNIGKLDATANYKNTIRPNTSDFYTFTLDAQSRVNVSTTGTGLAATTQIQIQTADGTVIGTSTANGSNGQQITDQTLEPGTYFVRVLSSASSALNYDISIGAAAQLPVNLFFPTTPNPLQLTTLTGTAITPTTTVSVLNPYTLNANYNVEYTGRPLSSFKLAFFLSSSAAGTPNDYRFDLNSDGLNDTTDFITISNQAPGTVISGTRQLTLPPKESSFWTQDGTYYIRVILDPENEIPEADLQGTPKEDDNQTSVAIRVRDARLPDLTPNISSVPGSANKGDQITVTGDVRNIGTAASDTQNPPGSTFDVFFYLSRDTQFDPGLDFSLGSSTLNPIATGQTSSFNQTLGLPTNWSGYNPPTSNNDYYLLVVADPDQTVNELTGGTTNNVTSRLIRVA